jgi:hypothetical protein
MSREGVDAIRFQESVSPSAVAAGHDSEQPLVRHHDGFTVAQAARIGYSGPRRTPRKSLIVVLPENHFVPVDLVVDRLSRDVSADEIGVILACAGQPTNIASLRQRVRDVQVVLAPAGTSGEDLRELAMNQAPGDIVSLLSGTPA